MVSRSWKEDGFSSAWRHSVLSTSFAGGVESSWTLSVLETEQYLANLVSFLLCNFLYFLASAAHSCSNHPYRQTEGCIRSQTVSIKHCLHFVAISEKDGDDGYVMLWLLCTHLFVITWFALWVQGTNSEKCKQHAAWKVDSMFGLLCMQPL